MKTRKKLQAEKEEVVKKSVVLKLRVHKFINPTTLYPVFNTFFVSEALFHENPRRVLPYDGLFVFNRIVSGSLEGNYIKLTTLPIRYQCDLSEAYICSRFLSFGNKPLKDLADKITELCILKKELSGRLVNFPKLEEVLQKLDWSRPTFLISNTDGQGSKDMLSSTEIYISYSYAQRIGWDDPKECILSCIKTGRLDLPYLIKIGYMDYVENMTRLVMSYVQLLEQTLTKCKDSDAELGMPETLSPKLRTSAYNYKVWYPTKEQQIKYQVITASPNIHAIQILEVVSHSTHPSGPTDLKAKALQEYSQEFQVLQHLMHVPQNKLKRFQDKVCQYKEKPKPESESEFVKMQ